MDIAYNGTAAHVERLVRAWRRCDRVEEARQTERAHLNRSVTIYVDEDGMVVMRARLTPELGAVVQRALEAASDRLYQESRHAALRSQSLRKSRPGSEEPTPWACWLNVRWPTWS